jgi:hypothetical protein
MIEVLEFNVSDVERYADVLAETVAAVADSDRSNAVNALAPIAGEVWMGRLTSVGKAGFGGAATGARVTDESLRARTFFRDGFRCTYCGGRAVPRSILVAIHDLFPAQIAYDPHYGRGKTHPVFWALAPEADHVFAHSRGGANKLENLTTLHAACNTRKSDSLSEDMPRLTPVAPTERWDGLVSLYASLIAAGAGAARPAYHRKWARLYGAILVSMSTGETAV